MLDMAAAIPGNISEVTTSNGKKTAVKAEQSMKCGIS